VTRPHTRVFKDQHDIAVATAGATGLAVYVAICRIRSDCMDSKDCFKAGSLRIARLAGCSASTAKRLVPKLAAAGLFKVRSGRRIPKEKRQEENQISLTLDNNSESTSRVTMNLPHRVTTIPQVGSPRARLKGSKDPIKNKISPCSAGSTAIAAPAGQGPEDEIDPFAFYNT